VIVSDDEKSGKQCSDAVKKGNRMPTRLVAGLQRTKSDLIETFEIMNGHYNINQLDEGTRRGHGQKLFKRRFRLDIRKYAFCNRVIDNRNSHYQHTVLIVMILTLSK